MRSRSRRQQGVRAADIPSVQRSSDPISKAAHHQGATYLIRGCLEGEGLCAEAMAARYQRWLEAAGIVLVRQRPGSANGVMFVTLEDETGIANLVVWQKVFERYRRVILSSSMFAVRGRVQREGEVVHLFAHRIVDLSRDLASVGQREAAAAEKQGPVAGGIRVKARDFR